jgi:large subunit ribosomal protein L4
MTLTLTVVTPGSTTGGDRTIDLPEEIFDAPVNLPLMHQVVVAQLAAARQGTSSTKNRSEVAGGGRKPYRQKGTGRARQGSIRAPQFVGGGVVHGPQPRSYVQRTPKKMIAGALRGALSDRQRNDQIHVVSSLVEDQIPSTKAATALLAEITSARKVLVIALRSDDITWRSLRNHKAVHLLDPGQLNTYDVLVADEIVFVEDALQSFLDNPRKGRSAKAAASSFEVDADDLAVIDSSAVAADTGEDDALESAEASGDEQRESAVELEK